MQRFVGICKVVSAILVAVCPALAVGPVDRVARVVSVSLESTGGNAQARGVPVQAKVVVENVSSQVITAVTIRAVGRYPDGSEVRQEATRDMVAALALERFGVPVMANQIFRPMERAVLMMALPADGAGRPANSAVAEILMVALADRTAFGSDPDIDALMKSRHDEGDDTERLVADIESLRLMPDSRRGLETLMASIKPRRSETPGEARRFEQYGSMLKAVVGPLVGDATKLDVAARLYRARVEHCLLKRGE